MLAAVPIIIVAFLVIPKDKKNRPSDKSEGVNSKLPSRVYYYSVLIVIFLLLFNVATVNISTHIAANGTGDSSTAGIATALLMGGGVVGGFIFPKMSQFFRDNVISLSFLVLSIAFTLMNLFPVSLSLTFIAMFLCGTTMGMFVPRCLFCVSNLSNPSNSATATMLVSGVAPGIGGFMSPVIITNTTIALGNDSTRFRFQFTAAFCLAAAIILFIYNIYSEKRVMSHS